MPLYVRGKEAEWQRKEGRKAGATSSGEKSSPGSKSGSKLSPRKRSLRFVTNKF